MMSEARHSPIANLFVIAVGTDQNCTEYYCVIFRLIYINNNYSLKTGMINENNIDPKV